MEKGVIYYAFNKTSGKYYIGQTTKGLNKRMKGHYQQSRISKNNHHFMRALRFYKKDEWEWGVLETVDKNKLNEKEVFYIRKYDSFENGYNGNYGGVTSVKPAFIHSLYHPDHGVLNNKARYFIDNFNFNFTGIGLLKAKKVRHYKGWVLAEYKDNYDAQIKKKRKENLHSLYHKNYGVVTDTITNISKLGVSKASLVYLINKKNNQLKGWVRAEDKDRYDELNGIMVLKNNKGNTIKGTATELSKEYGKTKESFRRIFSGRGKTIKINGNRYHKEK